MSLFPILLSLLAQAPAPLSGTAVDREGRPLAGVEIVLAQSQALDGTVPILARAITDSQGRYTIVPPASEQRSVGRVVPFLGAYRPGLALGAFITLLKKEDPGGYRLSFDAAGKRTITLRGGDGRPLAGVRLAPLAVVPQPPNSRIVTLPDSLVDRMEVTTGPDGRAELACLAPTTEVLAIRATIPGLGTQGLAIPRDQARSEAVTLVVKPAGRLSGRVVHADGRPAKGAQVEVWAQLAPLTPITLVRFESGPVRTGEDGTFQTPAALLAGLKYRVLVRLEGFKPFLTEWVTPTGKADGAASLAPILLVPPRSVAGRVLDRRGRGVAGAEIIAGGEEARAVTDQQGNFRLDGLAPTPTFLVVRREGFRIDGQVLEPGIAKAEVALARFDEPAPRPLTTLKSPVPLEERRRLARRVLEPFLVKVLAKGEDSPKHWALRSLMVFDPAGALEAIEKTTFRNKEYSQSFLRFVLSGRIARDDPEEAAAVAESIPQAFQRARALVDLVVSLPDGQRTRKRALIDRILVAARAEPDPKLKVWGLGDAAELLLDLGETDRAKAIFAEGLPVARQLGPGAFQSVGRFAARLARVDLPAALALLGEDGRDQSHRSALGNLAARIAGSNPAEAERLARKIQDWPRSRPAILRTCKSMARTDLSRAQRIANAQDEGMLRAGALIFTAYGLPASERQTARELVREAVAEIDRTGGRFDLNRFECAAYMPLVETIDPGLVPELFWRKIADLPVGDDPRVEYGRNDVLREALLLARYDRQVASALYEPAGRASAAKGTDDDPIILSEVVLIAAIDPLRAVSMVEAMPQPSNLDTRGVNWLRITLSNHLGRDDESYWYVIWQIYSGLAGALGGGDLI